MKIAILTSGVLPVPAVRGGAVENLIDFYIEYNERHQLHDITVYSVSADKENLWTRIQKKWFQRHHSKGYYHHSVEFFFEKAYQKLQKENYDLIIVENRPGYALKLQERTNVPCILHLHNDFLNPETKNAIEIVHGFKRIICVSDFITQRVKEICPEAKNKCITVYNAIDLQRFEQAQRGERKSVGLSENDFVIVYSGRLTKDKGILQLIQAIKQIQTIPTIKLLIIGASAYGKDKQPTSYIQQLERETISISDIVIFTGYIDYRSIPSYLKMADIAVIPSMWEEPFGLTVVEAMAAGIPLITTQSGGIPEICKGVASIVERDDIVSNLSAAIIDLYQHPEKRNAMSQAALQRATYFNKERYAREFYNALTSI